MSRHPQEPGDVPVGQRDRVSVGLNLLGGGGHVVEVKGSFEPEIGMWDPSQPPVSDHHISPRGPAGFGSSPPCYVLGPTRRYNLFVGLKVSQHLRFAGVQQLPEGSHDLTLAVLGSRRSLIAQGLRVRKWLADADGDGH